ncbi:MAG: hypothetical protein F6K31_02595 [Symploca sp. SIO2G7]|nr:hypothetical protein [Symploca sp. SIO2G7]
MGTDSNFYGYGISTHNSNVI